MDEKFKIYCKNEKWHVVWSHEHFKRLGIKSKLLNILFGEIKVEELGLSINLYGDEVDTMYVTYPAWAQDKSGMYSEYIAYMYNICGVILKNKDEAEKLYDKLTKLYMWKELQS